MLNVKDFRRRSERSQRLSGPWRHVSALKAWEELKLLVLTKRLSDCISLFLATGSCGSSRELWPLQAGPYSLSLLLLHCE